jgi:hypothetical protein
MTDPYADFTATDADGAELSIVWVKGGGARISVGGNQPLDQPPCSRLLGPRTLLALYHFLRDGRDAAP